MSETEARESSTAFAGRLAASVRDDRLSLILDLGTLLYREVGFDELFRVIGERVARALGAERATVFLVDAATGELRSHVASPPETPEIRLARGQGIAGSVALSGKPILVPDTRLDARFYGDVDKRTGFTTRSVLAVPIVDARRATRGVLQAMNHTEGPFTDEDVAFLSALAAQIALVFEWTTLRSDDAPRGVWVRGPYNRIVGDSAPMQRVYERLERAAATNVTVLLSGETGTGKGLVARALHANGARRDKPFVTVDCTTLPGTLIESELFGYERGAFTGADRRMPGKIEGAHGGTLFLDEIGELAPPAQAKLLRLLQDRCFERVGGRETVEIDVRIVAATHRDLAAEVEKGTFRADLLYRLRVVELPLPSLRERGQQEILALAKHFLGVHTRRHGRPGLLFDAAAEAALAAHTWPGNVREIEHAVERAVVLAEGNAIRPEHLGLVSPKVPAQSPGGLQGVLLPHGLTLDEATTRYADATIAHVGGNRTEAAKLLGVGRNTLARKVTKSLSKRMRRLVGGRWAWLSSVVVASLGSSACRPSAPSVDRSRNAETIATRQMPPLVAVPAAASASPTAVVSPAPSASAQGAAPLVDRGRYPWLGDTTCASPPVIDDLSRRFPAPAGFERVPLSPESFGAFLRTLPLAAADAPVRTFQDKELHPATHPNVAAVAAIDQGRADLQQCADSIIRLHAEWRWAAGDRTESYRAAAGMEIPYARWRKGERPIAKGASLEWAAQKAPTAVPAPHADFRTYLDSVFMFANTGSLSVQAKAIDFSVVGPGDFVVQPGSPGHAVLILDVVVAPDGKKRALLGQGFMPAQSFHVLRRGAGESAWYDLDATKPLATPFWDPFPWSTLRRFP